MRLSCPACGACGSIEFFLMDAAARESVVAALNMPSPLGKQLMTYIGLFRPGKRALTWDRVESLLSELLPHVQSAQLSFDGNVWPAPAEYWRDALTEMLLNKHNLTTPLKNHNYLFRIVANKSNSSAAKKEQKREEQRRNVPADRRSGGFVQVGEATGKSPRTGAPKELLEAAGVKKSHAQQ
jgi:hypothetical protein